MNYLDNLQISPLLLLFSLSLSGGHPSDDNAPQSKSPHFDIWLLCLPNTNDQLHDASEMTISMFWEKITSHYFLWVEHICLLLDPSVFGHLFSTPVVSTCQSLIVGSYSFLPQKLGGILKEQCSVYSHIGKGMKQKEV